VVFTDNLGCIGVKSIEVDIKPPVIVTVDPTSLAVCKDGIVGNSQPIYGTVTSGLWPFIYTWITPPGIIGYAVPFYDTGNDRFNLLEESSQAISGTLVLTVTDNWGCTGTADAFITIDQGPLPTFTFTPVNCGATTVDLTAHFYIGSSSTGLDRFELYACDGTFIAEKYDEVSIFRDVDMNVYGNCFKLLTFTGSGCSVERRVIVPRTSGVQVVLSGNTQRCVNGTSAAINVSNASAFNSFKWSDGATTSGISVSPSVTTTYIVTATETNGCSSTASRTITVHPAPVAGFSGSTSICPGTTTILTGSSNINSSTFLWTNVATNATFNTRSITVSTSGTYTLEVTSPEGCKSIITVRVIESSTLSPKINELTLCDMMGDTLNAGSGFDKYLWSTGDTLQKIVVTAGGEYSVTVSKGTCSGADTVLVINNATPVFNISHTPITVCRTNDGFGPSYVDFNAQINPLGVSGTWTELTSSGVDISDPANVSFLNKPVGVYSFEFNSTGALAPCENIADTLYVAVNACQCPQILNTGPLCNKGSSPVDMKTRKGNPALGGTFSVISPAGINMVNDIFNPAGLAPGIYVIEWNLTPTCKPTVNITVYDSPKVSLTVPETTLCNDNATGSTTLNLNTFLGSGSSAGTWKIVSGPASTFIPPSTVDATGLNKNDVLLYRFITNSAQSPCRNDSIDFKIIIRDCKCPDVNITPLTLCNGNNTPLDLNSPTILTTNPAGVTGTWTSTAPGAISGGQFFNPSGITAGPYTITFRLTNAIAGCQRDFIQNMTISRQPVAIAKPPLTACNVNTGNGPTILRLSDLLEIQSTSGGTWTQTSGTPTLVVNSGQIDFTGLPEGSVFKFTYSLTANAPCTPVAAEATVTVIKCDCPPLKISVPGPLCNESGLLNLNTLKVSPTGGGSWIVKNNLGNIVNTSNDILDAKGLLEGIYRLTFSLVPAPAGNCKRDSTVLLKIEKQNLAVTRDTVVCNVLSSKGPSTLDFRSLLKATTGAGKWVDEDGTDVPNFTNVSFVGKPLGKITYYYSLPSVSPCVNRLIPATVEVIDCSCEQINLKAIPSMCTDKPSFDLKLYSDPKPGTWKATNPLVSITNGVLNLNNLPAGIYELYYELITVPAAPCPRDKKINITVFNPKSAGSARGAEFCLGSTDLVNLYDRLDNEAAGGVWSVVSGGNAGFNASAGTFNLTGRSAGSYLFKYSFSNQAPCPNDEENVTIKINDLPVAVAGPDKTLNCAVQSAQIGTDQTSSGTNIVYEWKKDGSVISDQKKLTVLEGGNYTLTVRDTITKCAASDRVTVVLDADLPVFSVKVDTISCFGQTGTITLSDITGGKSPYQMSFDGGKTYGSALVLGNLKTGKFKILVKDANGCINDRFPEISMKEPALFAVNLGQDLFLNVGQDTILSIKGQYNDQTAKSVTWTANGVEIDNAKNKSTITVKPEDDTEYKVTVINQSGCIATDIVKISIRRVKPECVPNIITPGSAGGNNYFSINCAEVDRVTKYSIYDRWGNLLFTGENLNPSQPQTFWDGRFKGKDVVPGVYVYYLEMLFKDGTTEKRGGDVTVLR
jgi:gliding motility-associated-like protein